MVSRLFMFIVTRNLTAAIELRAPIFQISDELPVLVSCPSRDKTMSRLITLKFSEIIFAVFTMLKMNVVIKEIEITMMVFLSLMIFFRI